MSSSATTYTPPTTGARITKVLHNATQVKSATKGSNRVLLEGIVVCFKVSNRAPLSLLVDQLRARNAWGVDELQVPADIKVAKGFGGSRVKFRKVIVDCTAEKRGLAHLV